MIVAVVPILTDGKKVRLLVGEVIVLARVLSIALICFASTGCVIVKLGVTNPNPGVSKVAIVPFFNLSQEETVNGREFALAYYAELQKVPGYDVLPVGLAEIAITENELAMDGPEDVLALIKILKVDAVVIGTITDYDPYYPPRIGMQIDWYALNPPEFAPGVQSNTQHRSDVGSLTRKRNKAIHKYEVARRKEEKQQEKLAKEAAKQQEKSEKEAAKQQAKGEGDPEVVRGQSIDSPRVRSNMRADLSSREWQPENSQYGTFERQTTPQTSRLVGFETESVFAGKNPLSAGWVSANPSHQRPLSPKEALIPQVLIAPGVLIPARSAAAQTLRRVWNESRTIAKETTPLPPTLVAPGVLVPTRPRERREPRTYRMSQWGGSSLNRIPVALQSPAQALKPVPTPTLAVPPSKAGPPLVEELPPPDESAPPIIPEKGSPLGSPTENMDFRHPIPSEKPERSDLTVVTPQPVTVYDPRKPFMSYTRLFDGADTDLTAILRDYVELRDDNRSGGWEAYLRRSEDFIRFTAHRMIVEMLTLHGGEGQRRIIFKMRKYR